METTTILSLTSATLPIYYKCEACDYTSILKANYDRHMLTKKHLKNIEKNLEKNENDSDNDTEKYIDNSENGNGEFNPPQNIIIQPDSDDIFYATKIYNTLFELKRQYPNKYQFVRNTDRMKREWVRWTQEQYDNDYVYCYTKWFREISKCNNELIGRFVF